MVNDNIKGNYFKESLNDFTKPKFFIKNLISEDEHDGDLSHRFSINIIEDGKTKTKYYDSLISSLSECPEDAIIGRSLVDGNDLLKVFCLGLEIGLKGIPVEIWEKYELSSKEEENK